MSYRAPFWVCLHAWRVAGSSALTVNGGTASGFPVSRVVDDQAGPLFKWATSGAGNQIKCDRGAGTLEACDRLLIPTGHNLNGTTLQLATSATGTFGGEETTRVSVNVTTTGVQSHAFNASTTHRYHLIGIGAVQGALGEVYVGRDRTPTRGPDPDWTDDPTPNMIEETLRSGNTYRVKAGERRRTFSYTFRRLESADLALFVDLLDKTSDGLHPFFWFPPDTDESPVFVQLTGPLQKRQDRVSPKSLGPSFSVTLNMLEVLA